MDTARRLTMLRELRDLERRRTTSGISPLEYMRWCDLMQRFGDAAMCADTAATTTARAKAVTTRMRIDFKSPSELSDSRFAALSPDGLFINTPFAPDVGTELVLLLWIESEQTRLEVPATVSSNNVGQGFSTATLGMGLRFVRLDTRTRDALSRLYELAQHGSD